MPLVYIALGSNLGDRWDALSAAVRRLRAEPGLRVTASSQFYETAPVNCPPGSGEFLNAVVAVETDRSPQDLLQLLLRIERQFGRVRSEPNSPRTLDLDLILYGDAVLNTPELTVPHPRMHERAFVLVPLAEIAPDAIHPILKKPVRELLGAIATDDIRALPHSPGAASRELVGLRALVTGSTSGIGATIANEFRAHGAEVITHGRSGRAGGVNPRIVHIAADLRDPAQVDRLANEAWDVFSGLDVLVCNAGADTLTGDAAKWSFDEKLEALLAVDLKATMRLSRDLGAHEGTRARVRHHDRLGSSRDGNGRRQRAVVRGGEGRGDVLHAKPRTQPRAGSACELRRAGLDPHRVGETASQVWQDRVRGKTPLGVWGLPDDVASAALWLASPASAFITGQTIRVNGGTVR